MVLLFLCWLLIGNKVVDRFGHDCTVALGAKYWTNKERERKRITFTNRVWTPPDERTQQALRRRDLAVKDEIRMKSSNSDQRSVGDA